LATPGWAAAFIARIRERQRTPARQWRDALPFILPTIIGLTVFNVGPVIASFLISLTRWNALSQPTWVGLLNYGELLHSHMFWNIFLNTAYFISMSVFGSTVLGLGVALLLNRHSRWSTLYRSLYFLPATASIVAVGSVWDWLLQPQFGLVNYLVALAGLKGPAWFSSFSWAMPGLILISIWRNIGYNMVIFLAGLRSVPRDLYEAARLDGASNIRIFQHVIAPLLSPATFFVLIVGVFNSYQVFDLTYVTTQGGPGDATNTLPYYVYQLGFQFFEFGKAGAVAYALFVVVLLASALYFATERRWVFYG